MKRDISIRPGVKVILDIDDVTGQVTLDHQQDVEPLLNQARNDRSWRTDWRPWGGNRRLGGAVKVCSLAPVHQMQLVQLGVATFDGGFRILDEKAFQRWLDGRPELKSTKGRAFNV